MHGVKKSSTIHRPGILNFKTECGSSYPSSVKGVGDLIFIAGHMVATGLSVVSCRIEIERLSLCSWKIPLSKP